MENLKPVETQTLRGLLEARAEALRHFIAAGRRNPHSQYGDVVGSVHSLSDESFAELTAVLSRLTLSKATESLHEVEAALERMREGSYGFCEACERRIGYGRLFVVPEARRCAHCQTRTENARGGRDVTPSL